MNKKQIFKNMSWLTAGLFLAKFFSGIYKIVLTHILGAENIGIYQQIFPIYTFLVVLVTAGVPLGVSKLLIKKQTKEEKINMIRKTVRVFLIFSSVISLILLIFGRNLYVFRENKALTICNFLLAPGIVASAIAGVLKGYFQGRNDFKPSAISQFLEQIIKLIFGLALSLGFARHGVMAQIIGAVSGVVLGDLASFIVLFVFYKKREDKTRADVKINNDDFKELVKIVLPLMLSSLVIPVSQMIDSFLVIKLLNHNFEYKTSSYLYGLQTGVVSALVNFPTALTFSLTSIMLPLLTYDYQTKNEEAFAYKVNLVVKIILTVAIPSAIFILMYSKNILGIIYGNRLDGFNIDGKMLTSKLMFWSGFNIIFLALSQFFAICLQARENRYLPFINNLIGMVVKFVLEVVFIPSTALNILAFTIATSVGYLCIFVLNVYELTQQINISISLKFSVKLLLANILIVIVSLLLLMINSSPIAFILVIALCVLIYVLIIIKTKLFSKKEIEFIFK